MNMRPVFAYFRTPMYKTKTPQYLRCITVIFGRNCFKASVAVSLEIYWPQNILLFSLILSEFYPLKWCKLLLHYKTIQLWNIRRVNSNCNGHFDSPPFSKTGNITKKTEHTVSQWGTFSPMDYIGLLCAVYVKISVQICTISSVLAFLRFNSWAHIKSMCNLYLVQNWTYSPSG